jgi:hypothetical protein
MPKTILCAHGNAFCSEQLVPVSFFDGDGRFLFVDFRLDSGTPRGWGRTFNLSGWYHVAIPNITYYDDAQMFIHEILILFRSSNMTFNQIDIWEGGSFLWSGAAAVASAGNLLFRPRDASGRTLFARSGLGISLNFTNTGGGFLAFGSASVTLDTRR